MKIISLFLNFITIITILFIIDSNNILLAQHHESVTLLGFNKKTAYPSSMLDLKNSIISEFSDKDIYLLKRNDLIQAGLSSLLGCTTRKCLKIIGDRFNLKIIITGSVFKSIKQEKLFYNISIFDVKSEREIQCNDCSGQTSINLEQLKTILKSVILKHLNKYIEFFNPGKLSTSIIEEPERSIEQTTLDKEDPVVNEPSPSKISVPDKVKPDYTSETNNKNNIYNKQTKQINNLKNSSKPNLENKKHNYYLPNKTRYKIPLAILNLNYNSSETKELSSIISDQIALNVLSSGNYRIIERSYLNNLLTNYDKQLLKCSSLNCAVKIGKLLKIRKIIIGKIEKKSSEFIITTNLIDIQDSKIENTSSINSKCKFFDLINEVYLLSSKILDKEIVKNINKTDLKINENTKTDTNLNESIFSKTTLKKWWLYAAGGSIFLISGSSLNYLSHLKNEELLNIEEEDKFMETYRSSNNYLNSAKICYGLGGILSASSILVYLMQDTYIFSDKKDSNFAFFIGNNKNQISATLFFDF